MQNKNFITRILLFFYTLCFATTAKAFSTGGAAFVFITEISEVEASHLLIGLLVLAVKSFIGSIIGLLCKKILDLPLFKSGGKSE